MKHYFRNTFLNIKLDIFNYPLCELGFVCNLSEADYRIIGNKGSFRFDRLSRDFVNEKNANIKNVPPRIYSFMHKGW